jgi:hypothetical protein
MHILADIGIDNVILVGIHVPVFTPLEVTPFPYPPGPMVTTRPATLRDAYEYPEIVRPFQELRIKYPDGSVVDGLLVFGEKPEIVIYGRAPEPAKMERRR